VKQEDVPILDEFVSTLDGSVNASIQARCKAMSRPKITRGHGGEEG
jgi:hypothetical protein